MTLTADEILFMQEAVTLALPESGTITRATKVSDGMGGSTVTWTTVATDACRVDPARQNAAIQLFSERIGERQGFVINFPAGTDVVEGDRVSVDSVSYEVLGILSGSWELVRQVVVVRQE